MKALLPMVLLASLTGCGTVPPEGARPAAFRVVEEGSYAEGANEPVETAVLTQRIAVASTPEEYGRLWNAWIRAGSQPPSIDFARETAVFLLLGQRRTGGHGLTAQSVSVEGNAATVTVQASSPEPGSVATMAISAPWAVLAVSQPGLTSATWVDPKGTPLARSESP